MLCKCVCSKEIIKWVVSQLVSLRLCLCLFLCVSMTNVNLFQSINRIEYIPCETAWINMAFSQLFGSKTTEKGERMIFFRVEDSRCLNTENWALEKFAAQWIEQLILSSGPDETEIPRHIFQSSLIKNSWRGWNADGMRWAYYKYTQNFIWYTINQKGCLRASLELSLHKWGLF